MNTDRYFWKLSFRILAVSIFLSVSSCVTDKNSIHKISEHGLDKETRTQILGSITNSAEPDDNLLQKIRALQNLETTNKAPLWPIDTALMAEVLRKGNPSDRLASQDLHFKVFRWAADDPFRDGWGGSAIVSLSLLRLTQGASASEFISENINSIQDLLQSKLVSGVLTRADLISLPSLEEAIWQQVANTVLNEESKFENANQLLLNYLKITNRNSISDTEIKATKKLVASGYVEINRLDLMRAKRQFEMRNYNYASALLEKALQSDSDTVLSEAHLINAKTLQSRGFKCRHILKALNEAVDAQGYLSVVHEARYRRGKLLWSNPNCSGEPTDFLTDINAILENNSDAGWRDDALYLLARNHEGANQLDLSLDYYEKLSAIKKQNDWLETSCWRQGWVNYRLDKKEIARRHFNKCAKNFPEGDYALSSRFWSGRISEELGEAERAKKEFLELRKLAPWSYYGLRARLHIEHGPSARNLLIAGPIATSEIRTTMAERPSQKVTKPTLYSERFEAANNSGLYQEANKIMVKFREKFPNKRVSQVNVDDLEKAGLLQNLVVLLALRQDLIAASKVAAPGDWPALGQKAINAGDISIALHLIKDFGIDRGRKWEMQRRTKGYLQVAFPDIYSLLLKRSAKDHKVPAALLYAVMRHESLLDKLAFSKRSAMGLFQFIPATFQSLDKNWSLRKSANIKSMENYLFSPNLSIDLGGRWFSEELLPRNDNDIFLAILEHHAGYPTLRKWKRTWNEMRVNDDIEFKLETTPSSQSRIFAREVLSGYMIMQAAGRLE